MSSLRVEAPSTSATGVAARYTRWLPLGTFIAALTIGCIGIASPSYWFDEAASLSVATRSFSEQVHLATNIDAVHALYNVILGGWISIFGASELATRSLSLITFAAAAFGFSLFARRIRTPLVALAGSLAFVLLPGLAWAAGETRGYAFSLACAVWGLVLLESVLSGRGPFSGRTARVLGWILYAFVLSLMLAFSLLTALAVFGHLVFVWQAMRSRLIPFVASWFAAVLASAPLVLRAAQQTHQVEWIDNSAATILSKVVLGQLFWGPRYNEGASLALVSAVALMLICAVLVVIALVRCVRTPSMHADHAHREPVLTARQSVLFGAVLFGVPTALLAGATIAGSNLYEERYLLFAAPGFCLVLAEGIAALRTRPGLALAAGVAIVITSAPQLVAARGELSKSGDNYRGLASAAASADVIFYVDPISRGIEIAYRELIAADDVLLLESAEGSGTLWGENAQLEEVGSLAAEGEISVVIQPDAMPEPMQAWLTEHQCVELPTGLVSSRFTVANYSCSGPRTEDG